MRLLSNLSHALCGGHLRAIKLCVIVMYGGTVEKRERILARRHRAGYLRGNTGEHATAASGPAPAKPETWAAAVRELLTDVHASMFTLVLPLIVVLALVAVLETARLDAPKAALRATALLWLGGLAWLAHPPCWR